MVTLSVIIPVYNVAPYIRKTLDSVVSAVANLRGGCVEIVCVDDGSADGSGAILDEYGKKVERLGGGGQLSIKVLHQPNHGVSAARNAALDLATGEWVMMLDGDDTWAEYLLVKLFDEIDACPDCDAVCFGLEYVDENGCRVGELGRADVKPAVMTGDEVLLDGRGSYSKFIWSSCDKIYRRSIIEKIPLRYADGMKHGEDSLFSQVFLAYADKVVLRPDILGYKYFMRDGSAVHVQQTRLPDCPFRAFETLYAHWRKLKTPGLRLRLYYVAVGLPSLGKGEEYARSVRAQAIGALLASETFNRKVMPFSFWHGGVKAKAFSIAYLISPRSIRRRLLEAL